SCTEPGRGAPPPPGRRGTAAGHRPSATPPFPALRGRLAPSTGADGRDVINTFVLEGNRKRIGRLPYPYGGLACVGATDGRPRDAKVDFRPGPRHDPPRWAGPRPHRDPRVPAPLGDPTDRVRPPRVPRCQPHSPRALSRDVLGRRADGRPARS